MPDGVGVRRPSSMRSVVVLPTSRRAVMGQVVLGAGRRAGAVRVQRLALCLMIWMSQRVPMWCARRR